MTAPDLATVLAEAHDLTPALAQRIADNYTRAARHGTRPDLVLDNHGRFTAASVAQVAAEVGDSRALIGELTA